MHMVENGTDCGIRSTSYISLEEVVGVPLNLYIGLGQNLAIHQRNDFLVGTANKRERIVLVSRNGEHGTLTALLSL